MKLFKCQSCDQVVYFENIMCEKCGHRLGFLPEITDMASIEPTESGLFEPVIAAGGRYRYCANASFGVCNWLVSGESSDAFCRACRHNRLIPDVGILANLRAWQQTEFAKHRLFYSLIRLRLPLENRQDALGSGLAFEFPASNGLGSKILTGHDNGVITIALEEADDVERETQRSAMHEPYRTLLGHFRHEIGHYYWDRLVRDGDKLEAARAVFATTVRITAKH